MIDIEKIRAAALAVIGWSNCNQAWLDTSEDESAAVVGHIDEDGNEYPVVTVDCELHGSGDSLDLAKFYAQSNPSAVLELIERLEAAERDAARWHRYSKSPQTALQLGSCLDPNSDHDWVAECNKLADVIIEKRLKNDNNN